MNKFFALHWIWHWLFNERICCDLTMHLPMVKRQLLHKKTSITKDHNYILLSSNGNFQTTFKDKIEWDTKNEVLRGTFEREKWKTCQLCFLKWNNNPFDKLMNCNVLDACKKHHLSNPWQLLIKGFCYFKSSKRT